MRVVVTGVGISSALGESAEATISRLFAGERGFADVTLFSTEGYASRIAAEAGGLAPRPGASRSDMLAVRAATEALRCAGVDPRSERVELWVAASVGGMFETEVALTKLSLGEPMTLGDDLLRTHPTSAPADAVHAACGPFSTANTVCSACSSGAVALGLAADRVRRGDVEVAIAGGVDALSRLTFTGFSALVSLDSVPCRPFDRDRAGLTLGEAAAFVVLERADRAAARGARVVAELAGFSLACEAHHVTQPEESGATAERVMRGALERAGLSPRELAHVTAHGTGTPRNDAMEAHAIARVLGAARVPVSSPKAQLGHTLAAAGALSAAIAAVSVERGIVPPAVGVATLDPTLPIVLAAPLAEVADVGAVLVNAFGFGGGDAALVVARPGRGRPRAPAPDEPLVIAEVASLGALGALVGVDAARYADETREADVAAGPDDPRGWLDSVAVKRADITGRYALALALAVLTDAFSHDHTGVVTGHAFPAADASAAFYARVLTKGPRFAPPLAFPGLVPSAPASIVSIGTGARGPSLAVSDLGVTALAALATAVELLRGGHARTMLAIAVEPESMLVDRVLAAACGGVGQGPRGAGGAAVRVERRSACARPLAAIERVATWRGAPIAIRAPTTQRAEVFAVDDTPAIRALAWRDRPLSTVRPRAGWHEAAGGIALAAAAARIASGAIDEALVLLSGPGRGGMCILVRP